MWVLWSTIELERGEVVLYVLGNAGIDAGGN